MTDMQYARTLNEHDICPCCNGKRGHRFTCGRCWNILAKINKEIQYCDVNTSCVVRDTIIAYVRRRKVKKILKNGKTPL